MASRDKATNQLEDYKRTVQDSGRLTTSDGCPVGDKTNTLTAGPRGPVLLEDVVLIDEMAHFDRERIPERVVHAKGAGAYGYFEVTHDISKYCKASIFSTVGKKTPLFVRFSTVGGESGSADTARDPRGFAIKFYTDEGNWDLVGNNTPIFFIRDPFLFPSFIHTQKRNPATHLKDPDMFWDFISLRPETAHQVAFLFSDRGTPCGYRHMNGYGSHTFKMVNEDGKVVFCKFHFKTNQKIKNFNRQEADDMSRDDPDFSIRDLYNSIAEGNLPSWNMFIQVMTPEQAASWKFNPFDLTKVWPQGEFPLIPVGKMTLDKNPKNYFAEVEQSAFAPANLVPGIEASPDKMLQARLFSYRDTHRHRLGANFNQIPINCPFRATVRNYQRDGPMTVTANQEGAPNYFPNSFSGPTDNKKWLESKYSVGDEIARHNSSDEDNFTQVGIFFTKVLNQAEKERLVDNMGSHLANAQKFIQDRVIANYTQASSTMGKMLQERVNFYSKKKSSL